MELCHDGHQGVTKAKSLLRTFCWFPCIDKLVEKQIRQCLPCQSVRPPIHKEPIQPSELPRGPWQYVEMAFENVKASIDEYSQLHHYVVGRETELVVDASETGLGCVLMQRQSKNEPYEPVMFKSKALKESEQGWSPTERESLAIRWAVKKLRKYLIGAPKFRIVNDHKPLKYMFHKTHGDLPPRVEKMVMNLQAFDYTSI